MYIHSAREPSPKSFVWNVCVEKRLQSEGESASCFHSLPVVTSTRRYCIVLLHAPECALSSVLLQELLESSIGVLAIHTHTPTNRTGVASVGLSLCSTYIVVRALPGRD